MSKKRREKVAEPEAETSMLQDDENRLAADTPDDGDAADPVPAPNTQDAVEALHGQLADLQAQLAEQVDRRLRLAAELDNLRKRSRREVADARRFAQADLLRPLLEVLDNFERALRYEPGAFDGTAAGTPTDTADDPAAGAIDGAAAGPATGDAGAGPSPASDAFRQGVELIAQSFRQTLLDCGVRRIETAGRVFDPALHEAVGQARAPAGVASGNIMTEVQSGYTFDDLVLRASRVIVAQ
jgi:molecular chaperone GrpE